jgi:hypothetical protein
LGGAGPRAAAGAEGHGRSEDTDEKQRTDAGHAKASCTVDYAREAAADMGIFGIVLIVVLIAAFALGSLVFAIGVTRAANRPRPALPSNCGDCIYMIPRAKVYRRETLEDTDGIVHYLCQKRWIEVTPVSPWCELGKSKTRTTTVPT